MLKIIIKFRIATFSVDFLFEAMTYLFALNFISIVQFL